MDSRLIRAINEVLDTEEVNAGIHGQIAGQGFKGLREDMLANASRQIAGTGKPISELYGAAQKKAILAAIGGGSKENGGNGIAGGNRALRGATALEVLTPLGITLAELAVRIAARYIMLVRADKKANRLDRGNDKPTIS